jgi:hypothetical protein
MRKASLRVYPFVIILKERNLFLDIASFDEAAARFVFEK